MEGHGTTQQHSIYSNSLVHAATLRSMNEPEKQQKKKKKKVIQKARTREINSAGTQRC